MANPEHVAALKAGPKALLRWRDQLTEVEMDFRDADLRGIHLADIALSGANFSGADLSEAVIERSSFMTGQWEGTSLRGSAIHEVTFASVRMRDAVFSETQLIASSFHGCFLENADFQGSLVDTTTFAHSVLHGAKFHRMVLADSIFAGLSLSEVSGLDEVSHQHPTTIGMDTLVHSREMLPLAFLKGAGLPDSIIEFLPSLLSSMEAIQFYSCFISYSHNDEEFTRRLHGRLEQAKLRVWYAPEDMPGGKKLYEAIDLAIRHHDRLLLVLSEQSMSSEWVKTEIRRARRREVAEKRQVLFPIRLVSFDRIKAWEAFDADTGKDMAAEIREYFIPDFSNWKDHDAFEAGFAKLLRDLKKSAAR